MNSNGIKPPISRIQKKVLVISLPFLIFPALLSCGTRTVDSAFVAKAGKDARTLVGKPVSLDGTESKDLKGRHFDYIWTFARKPAGSKSVLLNDRTARPTFTPDSAGRFVVQLQLTDGTFSSEIAAATVDADYPPAAFLSVQTWVKVASNNKPSDYAVKLGLATPDGSLINSYTAPDTTTSTTGFMLLVLNKSDGTAVDGYPKTFPMANASTDPVSLQTELESLGSGTDKIVILSSLNNSTGFALSGYPGLVQALEGMGASSAVQNLISGQGYAMIGTNGFVSGASSQANAATAYEFFSSDHGNSVPDINGYFIRDPYQNFRFSYDYLPFETIHEQTSDNDTIPVNSIVIGNAVYPPPSSVVIDSSKNGGFHVLILKRDSLGLANQTFYQINSNGTANTTAMSQMGTDLYNDTYGLPWNDKYLVIITALGALPNIKNSFSNSHNYAYKTESAVDILGGTPGILQSLAGGSTYSLVGIGPGSGYLTTANPDYNYILNYTRIPETNYPIVSAEASSVLTYGSPADIRGLLKKDRLGFYAPSLWDGGGTKTGADYTLLPLAMQAPSAWRGPDTDKEKQVYQDIGDLLLKGLADIATPVDMRQYYFRTDFSWTDRLTILSFLNCQDLSGWEDKTLDCNDSDTLNAFSTMKSRLSEEILLRNDLQSWFYTDVRELLDGMEYNQLISLETDYQNALVLSKVSPSEDILMDAKTVVSDLIGGVASLMYRMGAPVPLPGDESGAAPHTKEITEDDKSMLNWSASGIGLVTSLVTLSLDITDIVNQSQSQGKNPMGTPPGQVKAAASEAFTQLMAQYINNRAILDQTFMFMTTDWSKLVTLHQSYSGIYDKSQYMNVLAATRPGADVYFYKVLLPVIFHAEPMPYVVCASIDGSVNGNPCGFFVCDSGSGSHHQNENCPFSSSLGLYRPADSMIGFDTLHWAGSTCSVTYPYSSYYTIWKSNSASTGDYYDDTDIKLFMPLSSGGLGVNQLSFATRWPFTYVWPTDWSKACNCSPATTICQ